MKTHLIIILSLILNLSFAQVAENAEETSPLLIGEKIPEVELLNEKSETVHTLDLVKKKPTIFLFFRGGWCPYCTTHLSEMRKVQDYLINKGYQIVAISPDSPNRNQENNEKNNFNYSLLADTKSEFIKAMGLAFKAPFGYGMVLDDKNEENLLPLPSVYIVNKEGEIEFMYASPNYKHRMSAKLLKAVVDNLGK